MSDKPTPLPSVEESLKAVAASVAEGQRYAAETRRILDQMARDTAVWKAEGQRYAAETRRILDQMARDSAEWQARHDKAVAEDRARQAEWQARHDKAMAEDRARQAEWQARHDKAMADHEQVMAGIKQTLAEASQIAKDANKLAKDALAIMKGVSEQWGGFTNTAGEILEKEVFEALNAAKKIGDIRLVEVNRLKHILHSGGKKRCVANIWRHPNENNHFTTKSPFGVAGQA